MLQFGTCLALVFLAFSAVTSFRLTNSYHGFERRTCPRKSPERNTSYWLNVGQTRLKSELNKKTIENKAKNVIIFIGDGMSISTVTAARIYEGQKLGRNGEEYKLSFEQFPYSALIKTYCVDSQVADSACSATALFCGVKNNIGTIGVSSNVLEDDCDAMNDQKFWTPSAWKWAQNAGKSTGIVTTTRITCATPAGTYSHTANRAWEDDSNVRRSGKDPLQCPDIAKQLVLEETGSKLNVIMGGGRRSFFPSSEKDPETGSPGRRQDGLNLVEAWLEDHESAGASYITNRAELLDLDVQGTQYLLGLFAESHMDYFLNSTNANDPTLEEMTRAAIQVLQQNSEGYILLVEGGRIDHAHHENLAKTALEEAVQFDIAIKAALSLTDPMETLIIVTADHGSSFAISGYPVRGNPILGLAQKSDVDKLPFTTLMYATGPGYVQKRQNLTHVNTASPKYRQAATVPMTSGTHDGADVGLFAYGPQAHLFQGTYEQNYIAHAMGYASCIGPGLHYCDSENAEAST